MQQRFIIINDLVRRNAARAVMEAPEGHTVNIAEPTRSSAQNARMWAMLADVARACPEGRKWTPETWKCAFMHSLGHQIRFAEGLDGSGPFPIGFHSSKLTVRQMADLITCVDEYGSRNGVEWRETIRGGFMNEREAA